MFPIKLQISGEQILRSYCKNRNHLYKVIEKDNGFRVRSTNLTWLGKLLKQGEMLEVDKQEDNSFDLYLSPNIIYELYFDEIVELINFIDKIRDKTPKKMDLRLFKDKK
jgi:hypothetical protein